MKDGDGRTSRNGRRRRRPDRGPKPSAANGAGGANGGNAAQHAGQGSKSSAAHRRSFDRYTALAREALSAGDAIEAENYHQHAEHYYRLLSQAAAASQ